MGTLIKRRGLSSLIVKKTVNNFYDNFISRDLSDWTEENLTASSFKTPVVNLKKTDTNIEVELAIPIIKREYFKAEIDDDPLIIFSQKREVIKKDNFIRRDFNYRSFCRLPNL